MNPKLTDDAVAGLPLHPGRAELLEEIMSTPVLDDRPRPHRAPAPPYDVGGARPRPPPSSRRWPSAPPGGPAAPAPGSGGERAGGLASQPTVAGGDQVVLDAPGWAVDLGVRRRRPAAR